MPGNKKLRDTLAFCLGILLVGGLVQAAGLLRDASRTAAAGRAGVARSAVRHETDCLGVGGLRVRRSELHGASCERGY